MTTITLTTAQIAIAAMSPRAVAAINTSIFQNLISSPISAFTTTPTDVAGLTAPQFTALAKNRRRRPQLRRWRRSTCQPHLTRRNHERPYETVTYCYHGEKLAFIK